MRWCLQSIKYSLFDFMSSSSISFVLRIAKLIESGLLRDRIAIYKTACRETWMNRLSWVMILRHWLNSPFVLACCNDREADQDVVNLSKSDNLIANRYSILSTRARTNRNIKEYQRPNIQIPNFNEKPKTRQIYSHQKYQTQ